MTKRGKRFFTFFSFRYGSQPSPLRGTSFQRKEGECASPTSHEEGLRYENTALPHSSFRAKARNLFRPLFPRPFAKPFRGSTASVLPRYGVSRSLLSNTLRLTANEKDPSTALGMTKRGKAYLTSFSTYSGFPASSFRAKARNLFRPLFPRPLR